MAAGTLLILSAVALILYNAYENRSAKIASNAILAELKTSVDSKSGSEDAKTGLSNVDGTDASAEMPIIEINGYGYIGYLTIPVLDLSLPIMAEWDYTRLKIAPCRQFGTVAGNDLVIAGHNYLSHFGNLKTLQVGDALYFTDAAGKVVHYEVSAMEILQPTQVKEIKNSIWDLTLYTCTYGGRERVVIRCKKTSEVH